MVFSQVFLRKSIGIAMCLYCGVFVCGRGVCKGWGKEHTMPATMYLATSHLSPALN